MPINSWTSVATYSDRISAEAIVGLLRGEGIPTYISSDEHVPGLGANFSVFVAPDSTRRAKWVLQQTHVTERELTFLAVGDSPEGAPEETP
jgi:cell division septation protein DedD